MEKKVRQEGSVITAEEVKPGRSIREVKPGRKKRSFKFLLLYIAGFAFLIYASFTIISQGVEISKKRAELNELKEQLKIVEITNRDLEKTKNYSGEKLDEYIEKLAREDLDYVKNGERIFINISGD